MRLRHLLTLVIFLSFVSIAFAQNAEGILCRVLDTESKYPVSFATIQFEDTQKGVIADDEGEFRLPIDFKNSDKIISISSIGFETLKLSVSTLKTNTINIIYLKPKVEALGAVLITGTTKSTRKVTKTQDLSAKEIIQEAIRKIPVNYPKTPHSYIAYYRDYQLVNDSYFNLNESILENFDAGFQTNKYRNAENVTALYSYGLNKDFYLDSMLLKSIYNESKIVNKDESAKFSTVLQNELEILNIHNPIRNYNKASFSFINTFREDFVYNHLFKLQQIKYMDGIPLFEISFVSRDTENSKFKAKGKIYISSTNYAIYKLEYKMFQNAKFNQKTGIGSSISERLNTLFEINIEYKSVNDKMYLNYMTFNNRFIIKDPNPFKVADFEFDPNDKSFYITFNKAVDKESINRNSYFKIRYNDKKLIVNKIELVEDNIIKIDVIDWAAGTKAKLRKVVSKDFSYKLKRIKDVSGAVINKETKLIGFQFREFFTQEIVENKTPPSNLLFISKSMPLSTSKVNDAKFDINKYWINSPLKQTKGN